MSPIAKIPISFFHCLDMVLNSSSFYHIMLNLRCVIGNIYIHLFSFFSDLWQEMLGNTQGYFSQLFSMVHSVINDPMVISNTTVLFIEGKMVCEKYGIF